MKTIAVIYWSGTGNTQKMAEEIATAAQVSATPVEIADPASVASADVIALGCPSMGDEVLEESLMEPFICSLTPLISGKSLFLFGSYGWGSGAWMSAWEERMQEAGARLLRESLICHETPDDAALKDCRRAGEALLAALG
ncbi:flavodoxin domain-containing protein [Azotosporobacter soli]|uniref:flavodoxin domain-containing protein n=1 Tax=Azotosporobacter soli TaxID=3055040 RepID=UPI0031FEBC98